MSHSVLRNIRIMGKFQLSNLLILIITYSIEKYKEEMRIAQEKKDEEKAKAKMPPGTRIMSEEERIKTLEEL